MSETKQKRGARRTDPHRVGAIVPGHYSYEFSYSLPTTFQGWPIPAINMDRVRALRENGAKMASHGGTGKCTICGARFKYGDVWVHEPTGEHIHVGHICAGKYDMMADRSRWELENGRIRKAAAVEIEKAQKAERRKAFTDQHPGLAEAFEVDHRIIRDISSKLDKYGSISDKQVAFVLKLAAEAKGREKEKHVAAPTGRQTFVGRVVSLKERETMYGLQTKITVKVETPAGSWLAWGTCPRAILDVADHEKVVGRMVEITATLKEGRDEFFALMSRPKGYVLVDSAAA